MSNKLNFTLDVTDDHRERTTMNYKLQASFFSDLVKLDTFPKDCHSLVAEDLGEIRQM